MFTSDQLNYRDIILKELQFNLYTRNGNFSKALLNQKYIEGIARAIFEHAKLSLEPRFCVKAGHISNSDFVPESVGAHTNLVMAIALHAIDHIYLTENVHIPYSTKDIAYAIMAHDLPENVTGDTPDNSERDEAKKRREEEAYFEHYKSFQHVTSFTQFEKSYAILHSMEEKDTTLGRILYLADKLSAIISTLCYDKKKVYHIAFPEDSGLSKQCVRNMKLCEYPIQDEERIGYLLSELWTIDYLRDRKMYQYDETGFFTAILVITTLFVRGKWYKWREMDYR